MLKSCGWGGVGGGPCDYCVSPSPVGLDFGTLDFGTSDFGTSDFGLTKKYTNYLICTILRPSIGY